MSSWEYHTAERESLENHDGGPSHFEYRMVARVIVPEHSLNLDLRLSAPYVEPCLKPTYVRTLFAACMFLPGTLNPSKPSRQEE